MNPRRRFCLTVAAATAAIAPALALVLPATAQARVLPHTAVNYVALGDSYASGLGAGNYSDGNCDQSANAFEVLWANANHPASFANETCSGATTSDVINSQLSPLSSSTTLVSIVIGGNDVGFSNTMITCVLEDTSACVAAIQQDENAMQTQLPGEMDSVLSAIAAHAPNAHVVVLDYPELYDLSKSSSCIGLSTTDRIDLNQAADELDGQIQAAAQRHGDAFGDVRSAFTGHQICDSNSWLHSVDWLNLSDSYHPTASGQSGGYYPVFSNLAAGASKVNSRAARKAEAAAIARNWLQHLAIGQHATNHAVGVSPNLSQAQSSNWSGYADTGETFSSVGGSWTEPSGTCSGFTTSLAAFWVGIDGFSSGSVEQDGTLIECFFGTAYHFSWWEMYPTNSVQVVGQSVAAGDHISASVVRSGTSYALRVTDSTHPANSFSTTQSCSSCVNSSAEWIAEAPSSTTGIEPLTNFHTWTLSGATVSTGSASGVISTFPDTEITMVGSSDVKAQPSGLNSSGNGFSVTWEHSS